MSLAMGRVDGPRSGFISRSGSEYDYIEYGFDDFVLNDF